MAELDQLSNMIQESDDKISQPSEYFSVSDVKNDSSLWYKLHVLLYDLRNFEGNERSRYRLETVIDPSYLASPYFTKDEAVKLKNTLINDQTLAVLIQDTLEERLNRRMKKRVESGDYRVCAAHDIAPILEKAFNIRPKDIQTDKAFVNKVMSNGLQLGLEEKWTGLAEPSKIPNSGGKPKKKGKR